MDFQGKTKQQYKDSVKFTGYGFLCALLIAILLTLCGCYPTYYITDAEYSDAREEHASVTYWNNSIYWGWYDGYWWYYGKPHYYPWNYYYQFMPPHTYQVHTHVHVHVGNSGYVYRPRGDKFHNIGPKCPTNKGHYRPINVKKIRSDVYDNIKFDKEFFRGDGKTNVIVKPNRNNNVIVKPNRNIKVNKNKTNKNRVNTNRRPK